MAKTDYRQNARDIIEFLNNVKTESPDNVMTMFFVQKPSRDKYVSFRPQISNELQKKILSMILGPAIGEAMEPVLTFRNEAMDFPEIDIFGLPHGTTVM